MRKRTTGASAREWTSSARVRRTTEARMRKTTEAGRRGRRAKREGGIWRDCCETEHVLPFLSGVNGRRKRLNGIWP
jgi:hypothetical protein